MVDKLHAKPTERIMIFYMPECERLPDFHVGGFSLYDNNLFIYSEDGKLKAIIPQKNILKIEFTLPTETEGE